MQDKSHLMKTVGLIFLTLFLIVSCGRRERTAETDALLLAARTGNADTVKSLLTSPNVDINGRDEHGNTPLIEAARFGHDEVVTALLVAKADVNAKNNQGKTALIVAAEGGHDQTARTLTQAGAGR